MSDGSSGGFGDALESMTTNSKQAIGGTLADFTKSAANQVKGSGGVSGSFTPGQQAPGGGNPNVLSGGDLFSPDAHTQKATQQNPGGVQSMTQAGQFTQNPNTNPEELAKIQSIEQELRSLHQQYYQDFLAKAEGRDKKAQVEEQQKAQDDQQKQVDDMQKQEKKKQSDDVFRAQRGSEIKGGGIG